MLDTASGYNHWIVDISADTNRRHELPQVSLANETVNSLIGRLLEKNVGTLIHYQIANTDDRRAVERWENEGGK